MSCQGIAMVFAAGITMVAGSDSV